MISILNYADFLFEASQQMPPELEEAIKLAESSSKPNPDFIRFLKGPDALKFSSPPFVMSSGPGQIKNGTFVFTIPGSNKTITMVGSSGVIRVIPIKGTQGGGQSKTIVESNELFEMFRPSDEDQSFRTSLLGLSPEESSANDFRDWMKRDNISIYDLMVKFLDATMTTQQSANSFPTFNRIKGRSAIRKSSEAKRITLVNTSGEIIGSCSGKIKMSGNLNLDIAGEYLEQVFFDGDVINGLGATFQKCRLDQAVFTPQVTEAYIFNSPYAKNMKFIGNTSGPVQYSVGGPYSSCNLRLENTNASGIVMKNRVNEVSIIDSNVSGGKIISETLKLTVSGQKINVSGLEIQAKSIQNFYVHNVSKDTLKFFTESLGEVLKTVRTLNVTNTDMENIRFVLPALESMTINFFGSPLTPVMIDVDPDRLDSITVVNIKLSKSPSLAKAIVKLLSMGPLDWESKLKLPKEYQNMNLRINDCDFSGVDMSGLTINPDNPWTVESFNKQIMNVNKNIKMDPNSESPLIRKLAKTSRGASMFGV